MIDLFRGRLGKHRFHPCGRGRASARELRHRASAPAAAVRSIRHPGTSGADCEPLDPTRGLRGRLLRLPRVALSARHCVPSESERRAFARFAAGRLLGRNEPTIKAGGSSP